MLHDEFHKYSIDWLNRQRVVITCISIGQPRSAQVSARAQGNVSTQGNFSTYISDHEHYSRHLI